MRKSMRRGPRQRTVVVRAMNKEQAAAKAQKRYGGKATEVWENRNMTKPYTVQLERRKKKR